MTDLTVSQTVAPSPSLDTNAGSIRRRVLPVLSILAWFYVFAIGFLLGWVILVSVLLGWSPTVITTGSMQPAIRPGDVVLQRPPTDETLSAGTVITFEDPLDDARLVTHRIDEVEPGGRYTTKGDANGVADSAVVAQDDIVGVGRLLVPVVGFPVEWRNNGRWDLLVGWTAVTLAAIALAAWSPKRRRT